MQLRTFHYSFKNIRKNNDEYLKSPNAVLSEQPFACEVSVLPTLSFLTQVVRCMNICGLFVWGFSSHSRIFHSYVDVNIAGEGLQILTCALMAIEQ